MKKERSCVSSEQLRTCEGYSLRQSEDSCQEAECLCRRVGESEVCPASPVSLQGETGKWFEGGHHLHILSWFRVEALPEASAPVAPSPRKGGFLKDSKARKS